MLAALYEMKLTSIKLMPDYGCLPLWHHDDEEVGEIDPLIIPISYELAADLLDWAKEYNQTLNDECPQDSSFSNKELEIQFSEKGLGLAKRLNEELKDVEVVYFDIITSEIKCI